MTVERVSLDLGRAIERLVDTLRPVAAEAGVALDVELGDEPLAALADPRRVDQIASNLLSNALKFTPSGGTVVARVRADASDVVLEVEDTGLGIAPDLLPRLFDCCEQDRPHSGGRRDHLGLGLYIVRQLVLLHGGRVDVESDGVGRGTKVRVRLPSCRSEQQGDTASVVEDRSADLDGLRVLVVEDEPDSRELLSLILAQKGANVSSAGDTAEALAMFRACAPDVIVSDVELPGDDGYNLIRRLRADAVAVSAIALSGFSAARDAARALDAGFDVHVAKPVEPRALVKAVHRLGLTVKKASA